MKRHQTSASIRASIRATFQEGVHSPISSAQIFALLYCRLSKGRHRLSARLWSALLPLLFWSLDILLWIPGLETEIYKNDALVAFRFLICAGSLTVLGARMFTVVEAAILCFTLSAYMAAMILSFCFGPIRWRVLHSVGITQLVIASFMFLCWCAKTLRVAVGNECTVSNIAHKIQLGTLSQNSTQDAHFDAMQQVARNALPKDKRKERGTQGGAYWPLDMFSWMKMVAIAINCLDNVMFAAYMPRALLPIFVLLEAFELLALILLTVNETQVEPVLFAELLKISESGNEDFGAPGSYSSISLEDGYI